MPGAVTAHARRQWDAPFSHWKERALSCMFRHMAHRRDEENTIYPCMALPTDVHRVHAPDDDPSAQIARKSRRRSWSRALREKLRRVESVK